MNWSANWIRPMRDMGDAAPIFCRDFGLAGAVKQATLTITALGVYEVTCNGKRISDYVLAPGWTTYRKRLQYQQYDITADLQVQNRLTVTVGKGWYRSRMCGRDLEDLLQSPCGLLAQLDILYADGQQETIVTDAAWAVSESSVRFSEIYDGEIYDNSFVPQLNEKTEVFEGPWHTLIPQEGEKITEHERLQPVQVITTPKGETVIDFGQNITGYVEITVTARKGDTVKLSYGEVLDRDGNFYNENYANAKAIYEYTCHDGLQTYHPHFTFCGFRYARIDEFPGEPDKDAFTAIAVYSDLKLTGQVRCSDPMLNRFISNVTWSQKDNFLDIPTDCPQRDERLGWTGDAQIFVKAAAYNYDVERFFDKWLGCLRADQLEDGYVGHMIPDTWHFEGAIAGWADAAVICPWEIYLAYGNPKILKKQFHCMKKYIDYITNHTQKENLWVGCMQYGDWYAPDREEGTNSGPSDKDLIASAYYAYSTSLLVKAGTVLGEDVSEYAALHERIVKEFRNTFPEYKTQTECAIAVHFRLAEDCQAVSDLLAQMVQENGMHLTTGFIGTAYLLHALSDCGHGDVAYSLLLQKEYPSWLYAVTKGATTTWEHWNGIGEDGTFWLPNENSFNHYAYGAVIDWIYGVAAGIKPVEEAPGYAGVRIEPLPDERLDWLEASLETRHGMIRSAWKKERTVWRHDITVPVEAEIVIDGKLHRVEPGSYSFYYERRTPCRN